MHCALPSTPSRVLGRCGIHLPMSPPLPQPTSQTAMRPLRVSRRAFMAAPIARAFKALHRARKGARSFVRRVEKYSMISERDMIRALPFADLQLVRAAMVLD